MLGFGALAARFGLVAGLGFVLLGTGLADRGAQSPHRNAGAVELALHAVETLARGEIVASRAGALCVQSRLDGQRLASRNELPFE